MRKLDSSIGLLFYAIRYIEYGMGVRRRMHCWKMHAFVIFFWPVGGGSFGKRYVIQQN